MKLKDRLKPMKFITPSLAAVLFAGVVVTSESATADASFLIQLGTFASYSEATQKWEQVKAGNRDIVGALDGKISEVMLPSDPAPSYRTQAGPVPTRKEARELCNKLTLRGVNCLIVETAFAATDLAPEMAGEVPVSPNVVAQDAPVPVPVDSSTTLRATREEEQISTSSLAPVEGASPSAAIQTQPLATVSSGPAQMPDTVVIEGRPQPTVVASIPEPQATPLAVENAPAKKQEEQQEGEEQSFNPNDAKKSGFFRSSYRPYENTLRTTRSEQKGGRVASRDSDDDRPGFFSRLFGSSDDESSKPKDTMSADLREEVKVAEAIRVPLSTDNQPQVTIEPEVEAKPVAASAKAAPMSQASPHLYWAQIGYFQNETVAYAFNEHLRKFFPEQMKNTRLKINRPFGEKSKRASLRIGAFYAQDDVSAVCSEARGQGFRCTTIRDVVTDVPSIATSRPAKRKYLSPLEAVEIPAYRSPSRQQAAAERPASIEVNDEKPAASAPSVISDTGVNSQWVELGTFDSTQLAWDHWKSLQGRVDALGSQRSAISGVLGGSKFLLRAGPFGTDADAQEACKAIVNAGEKCSVASPF